MKPYVFKSPENKLKDKIYNPWGALNLQAVKPHEKAAALVGVEATVSQRNHPGDTQGQHGSTQTTLSARKTCNSSQLAGSWFLFSTQFFLRIQVRASFLDTERMFEEKFWRAVYKKEKRKKKAKHWLLEFWNVLSKHLSCISVALKK